MTRAVLLVSSKYPPEYAGSGLRAHRTYLRLRRKYGVEFEVLTNGLTHRKNETYSLDGVRIHRVCGPFGGLRGGRFRRSRVLGDAVVEWAKTEHLLKEFRSRVDLVHTFGNSWSVAAATFAAARWRLPLLRELVNDMADPYYPVQVRGRVSEIFRSDCTAMIAISRRLEALCKRVGVRDCRHRLNPVDETRFNPESDVDREDLRARYTRFNEDDIILVQVANYTPLKNHRFAVEVLSYLPQEYKLVLRGPLRQAEQSTFEEVKATIRRLDLEERVDLQAGFVEDIENYMRLSDVFLFPSRAEGLGTPILQAQACGRPVVANRIPGVTDDLIVAGRGGYDAALIPSLWAERVREASTISASVRRENARSILARSSTTIIDQWYMDILEEFTNRCRTERREKPRKSH